MSLTFIANIVVGLVSVKYVSIPMFTYVAASFLIVDPHKNPDDWVFKKMHSSKEISHIEGWSSNLPGSYTSLVVMFRIPANHTFCAAHIYEQHLGAQEYGHAPARITCRYLILTYQEKTRGLYIVWRISSQGRARWCKLKLNFIYVCAVVCVFIQCKRSDSPRYDECVCTWKWTSAHCRSNQLFIVRNLKWTFCFLIFGWINSGFQCALKMCVRGN